MIELVLIINLSLVTGFNCYFVSNRSQDNDLGLISSFPFSIIGKRIVFVRLDTPDAKGMPRNVFDLLNTINIGKHVQITSEILDILKQKIVEQQFVKYENFVSETLKNEQSTLEYNSGSTITLVVVNFNQ